MDISERWLFRDTAGTAVCVYEISGGYGLLPRILYYILFSALIFGHNFRIVPRVSLVFVMVYSGAAALHAFILVSIHKGSGSSAVDLDLLAHWPILAIGAITVVPILEWSAIVRRSERVLIVIAWGVFNWFGAVIVVFGVWVHKPLAREDICEAVDGTPLLNPYQLIYQPKSFNCTYVCFEKDTWLRSRIEARIMWSFSANGYPGDLRLYDHLFVWLTLTMMVQPFQMLYTWWMHKFNKTSWALCRKLIRTPSQDRSRLMKWGHLALCGLMLFLSFHNLAIFLATIVASEVYIKKAGYKTNDEIRNVGEWAGWVNVALVLAGLGLMETYDMFRRRKKTIEDEEAAAHRIAQGNAIRNIVVVAAVTGVDGTEKQ